MARLFADENFPRSVVAELRRLGHDAVTVQERGRGNEGTSDPEVLDLAVAESRAVLTQNRRHFIRLHRDRPAHSGIVVCTEDSDVAALAARIDASLRVTPDLAGQLLRVNRPA